MASSLHLALSLCPLSGCFAVPPTKGLESIFSAYNSEFDCVTCFVRWSQVEVAAGLS